MKQLLIILFITLGVVINNQAQSIESVTVRVQYSESEVRDIEYIYYSDSTNINEYIWESYLEIWQIFEEDIIEDVKLLHQRVLDNFYKHAIIFNGNYYVENYPLIKPKCVEGTIH